MQHVRGLGGQAEVDEVVFSTLGGREEGADFLNQDQIGQIKEEENAKEEKKVSERRRRLQWRIATHQKCLALNRMELMSPDSLAELKTNLVWNAAALESRQKYPTAEEWAARCCVAPRC